MDAERERESKQISQTVSNQQQPFASSLPSSSQSFACVCCSAVVVAPPPPLFSASVLYFPTPANAGSFLVVLLLLRMFCYHTSYLVDEEGEGKLEWNVCLLVGWLNAHHPIPYPPYNTVCTLLESEWEEERKTD